MLGYSEANSIYFTVGNNTGFARLKPGFDWLEFQELSEDEFVNIIESGSFKGSPDFKYFDLRKGLCLNTKKCHSAEHKTYNAFQKKIKNLKKETLLSEFSKHLPSLKEIKAQNSHSVFCGTSFVISSSIAIIMMCLPNLFHYKNTDPIFMIPWLVFSILVLFISSYLIQDRYLAKPNLLQLFIAQTALKEVINGNNSKPNN